MADPLTILKRSTRTLARLASEQERVAGERREAVAQLLADGWSLGGIAAELGVSKSAVQKMAR